MQDDPIAALAVDLNEESKAKRRRTARAKAEAPATGDAHVLTPEQEPEWAKVDFRGGKPHFPVYGESWQEERGGPIKYWHGNGWYLTEPPKERPAPGTSEAAVAAMNARNADEQAQQAAAEDAPAAGEEEVREEPEPEPEPEESDEMPESESAQPAEADESDERASPVIERLEHFADETDLGARTLVEDCRDFMLDLFKTRPKPWSATSEAEQRDIAAAVEETMVQFVRKVVETVRADGETQPIRCLLEGYAEKDGIKATLKVRSFSPEEELAAVVGLHKARGKMVLVTVASVDDYRGDRDPDTQPDQNPLDFEAGEPDDEDDGEAGDGSESEG